LFQYFLYAVILQVVQLICLKSKFKVKKRISIPHYRDPFYAVVSFIVCVVIIICFYCKCELFIVFML